MSISFHSLRGVASFGVFTALEVSARPPMSPEFCTFWQGPVSAVKVVPVCRCFCLKLLPVVAVADHAVPVENARDLLLRPVPAIQLLRHEIADTVLHRPCVNLVPVCGYQGQDGPSSVHDLGRSQVTVHLLHR